MSITPERVYVATESDEDNNVEVVGVFYSLAGAQDACLATFTEQFEGEEDFELTEWKFAADPVTFPSTGRYFHNVWFAMETDGEGPVYQIEKKEIRP